MYFDFFSFIFIIILSKMTLLLGNFEKLLAAENFY